MRSYGYYFCNSAIVIRVVGTPTITIDNVHKHRQHHCYPDADSISLVSSTAVPHIYQCKYPIYSVLNAHSHLIYLYLRSQLFENVLNNVITRSIA